VGIGIPEVVVAELEASPFNVEETGKVTVVVSEAVFNPSGFVDDSVSELVVIVLRESIVELVNELVNDSGSELIEEVEVVV